jgi:hypothetical protein
LFSDDNSILGGCLRTTWAVYPPESLEVRTEDCLNCVSYLMMAMMYQAVDIKPESLAVRTEDFLMCILFDDGYDVSGCGYKI